MQMDGNHELWAEHATRSAKKPVTAPLRRALLFASALTGCGGGAETQGTQPDSTTLEEMTSAFQAPTGTLSGADVPLLAQMLERQIDEASGLLLLGSVPDGDGSASHKSQSVACPDGGSLLLNEDAQRASATYRKCQMVGCTFDGTLTLFKEGRDRYSDCAKYDLRMDCEDFVAFDWQTSVCVVDGGDTVYLVHLHDETFTVSGSYYGGSGYLEIGTQAGVFQCDITHDTGTCTDARGQTIEF